MREITVDSLIKFFDLSDSEKISLAANLVLEVTIATHNESFANKLDKIQEELHSIETHV